MKNVRVILIARVLVAASLLAWLAVWPLLWILRDGLGPDSVETTGGAAVVKFAVGWGVPAIVLAGVNRA